ncbi:MAG: hypothetical protein ABSG94_13095 [Brevinematales bacterium]|jgi:preprotein translocase subunit SecG
MNRNLKFILILALIIAVYILGIVLIHNGRAASAALNSKQTLAGGR